MSDPRIYLLMWFFFFYLVDRALLSMSDPGGEGAGRDAPPISFPLGFASPMGNPGSATAFVCVHSDVDFSFFIFALFV